MRNGKYTPNAEQLAALKHFAEKYGRRWKNELRGIWMNGAWQYDWDVSGPLQQLRNEEFDLAKFRFPKPTEADVERDIILLNEAVYLEDPRTPAE